MNIEEYLDKNINDLNYKSLIHNYKLFGYSDIDIFKKEVDILLKYIYNYTKIKTIESRMHQKNFRQDLFDLYNNKCIISGYSNPLEAAHILEYSRYKDNSKYNGLLLTSSLHKLFDQYRWTINPFNFKVELNGEIINDEIMIYENKVIKNLPDDTVSYLRIRYIDFLNNKN